MSRCGDKKAARSNGQLFSYVEGLFVLVFFLGQIAVVIHVLHVVQIVEHFEHLLNLFDGLRIGDLVGRLRNHGQLGAQEGITCFFQIVANRGEIGNGRGHLKAVVENLHVACARVKRGQDIVMGASLVYNTKDETFAANGGTGQGAAAGKSAGRVTVILQPKNDGKDKKQ